MTATLLFVRHGSHDELGRVLSGRSDIGLNASGRAEAAALADHMAQDPPDAIHSSPRRRARETADAVARRTGVPMQVVDALDEIDFGAWTGRSFAELRNDPSWHRWNEARGTAPTPGGETMAEAIARAWRHLAALSGRVLAVSHCDIIRGVAATAIGLSLDRMLRFDCGPCSVTRLVPEGGGFRLVSLNGTLRQQSSFTNVPVAAYPVDGSQPGATA